MINLEHFQKILERKRTNAIELKDVPFFEIEKNGHVAYLLGTDHSYDLSTLPAIVLTHIREVDQLFTEQAIPSVKEFCDFLETLRIKQTEQVIWNKVLDPEELKLFRKMVEEAFATIASGLQEFPFDPLELDPSFLMHIVGQHVDCIIEKTQVGAEDDESEIVENPMMDAELMALFYDQTIPLEPDRSSVRTEEFDDSAIEKLKEKLLPFYSCSSKNLEELNVADRQAFLNLRSELASQEQEEKNSYEANFMKDFSREIDLDNEIEDSDFKMVSSNFVMFNSMDKSIANHRKPLYAAGADHLIGSLGLLNILRLKGYRVSKVVSEEAAKPIQYLYNQYLSSYKAIKQDILKSPVSNSVQMLLLTNPVQPIKIKYLHNHDMSLPNVLKKPDPNPVPRLLLKME